ncbi:MAG: hypothetical protein VKJ02_03310 [Snowella sp.]|nr:hypothetical protein [Snowella sp.]
MSNSVQKRVINNLEKAKSEGKERVEHIREIVKDAVSQTTAEVKEGSGEIGLIVKELVRAVVDHLQQTGKAAQEEITASVEGAIEGLMQHRQDAIAKRQAKLEKLQAKVNEQQQLLDQEIDGVLIDIKASEAGEPTALKSEIDQAVDSVQAKQQGSVLQGQYINLRRQLESLDQQLQERYGDRYAEIKRHLEEAKTWYQTTRTESENKKVTPVQEKQTQVETKLTEFASKVAQKENEVKERLHELWDSKKTDVKTKT